MKKLLILSLLILTSCTPNEADFKSNVPINFPIEDPIDREAEMQSIGPSTGLPSEINLDVPFFSQAPDADWGMPWQEACEEAASILAYYYATNQPLTKEKFKEEVWSLVEWQNEHFGGYEHSDINQTVEMIRGYFLNQLPSIEGEISQSRLQEKDVAIINNPSIDDLKKELSQGNPIIAPFAGRQLGNPFYSGEGPLYHMMVIKGYDAEHFITNDVGTKRGHNFIYPYETIMSAMHEWHDTDINLGAKKVIVIKAF